MAEKVTSTSVEVTSSSVDEVELEEGKATPVVDGTPVGDGSDIFHSADYGGASDKACFRSGNDIMAPAGSGRNLIVYGAPSARRGKRTWTVKADEKMWMFGIATKAWIDGGAEPRRPGGYMFETDGSRNDESGSWSWGPQWGAGATLRVTLWRGKVYVTLDGSPRQIMAEHIPEGEYYAAIVTVPGSEDLESPAKRVCQILEPGVPPVEAGQADTGMPVPMRQLSKSVPVATRQFSNRTREIVQLSTPVGALLCICALLAIGLTPAIWCLTLYGNYGDLPCDRPIAYHLRFMGFNYILIASLTIVGACIRSASGDDGEGRGNPCQPCIFLPAIAQLCQWIWLSGTCFWMYPYSDEVVSQLAIDNITLGHNGTQLGFWPGEIPWAIQWEPNLLNHGIEGCHPDLLFGARAYLIFGYILVGVLCCCLPVVICCALCMALEPPEPEETNAHAVSRA